MRKRAKILIFVALVTVAVLLTSFFYDCHIEFQTYYLNVMKELNMPHTKAYMLNKLNGTYNLTALLDWTTQHLNWSYENFVRYSSPQEILEQGKGRCEEFTIVYVSACLALDYEARMVLARTFYLWPIHGFHLWAEVKYNGVWTPVDPSPPPIWNNTATIKRWERTEWCGVKRILPRAAFLVMYAFESNTIVDVSATYK